MLGRVRLAPEVAATLRTAVDILARPEPGRRPFIVASDDAALEVRCEDIDPAGLVPAGGLLESVDGSLGTDPGSRGSWLLRVPVLARRGTYLLLEQGTLGLAIPWHAVIQIRMLRSDPIAETSRWQGVPVLPPFALAPRAVAERPVVLIGLGLKRAFAVADRLVWRMPADSIAGALPNPGGGLTRAVGTGDGQVFWVAEPSLLLRDVEPPPLPQLRSRTAGPAAGARAGIFTVRPPARPAAMPRPRLAELRPEDVEPLSNAPVSAPASRPDPVPAAAPVAPRLEPVPPRPAAAAAPVAPRLEVAQPRPAAAATAPRMRRALIAEDSITARVFLWRLLEQHGFEVHIVTSADGLRGALGRGPWTAIFADVELPDAHRGDHLRALEHPAGSSSATIALVRDAEDEAWAASAGVRHTLRKPFEREALERLLESLGLERAS